MASTSPSGLVRRVGAALARAASPRRRRPDPTSAPRPAPPVGGAPRTAYRGDFTGRAAITYAPRLDGDADPGEVVWAWVPYEEDHSKGKDRPVLVIGLVDGDLLGLMLTSQDQDRRQGPDDHRRFFDLGSGDWDRRGRPSEVRLDRVLRLSPSAVRREGAILEQDRFEAVAAAARATLGW